MSDFLTRLVQRQLGRIPSIEPRVRELYGPVAATMPLPITEAIPAEPSDARRVARVPTLPANPILAQTATAVGFSIKQGETAAVANFAQRVVTEPSEEHFPPLAMETVNAEVSPRVEPGVPPLVEPKLAVGSKIEMSLPSQSKPEPFHALSAQSETPATHVFFQRELQPQLMTVERVTPVAPPPRLDSKVSSRGEVARLEREHNDPEPAVQVTIGRIEVTAVTAAPAQKRAAIARKPAMSLDDYLARRQRGER
jgi:hypothetical protein